MLGLSSGDLGRLVLAALAAGAVPAGSVGCVCQPASGHHGHGPQGADGFSPIGAMGRESWTVEGTQYDIQSTYFLVSEAGATFVVEWVVPEHLAMPTGRSEAARMAEPLMVHAVTTGRYRRSVVRTPDGVVPVQWIGVVLLRSTGVERFGFRVRRSIDEFAVQPDHL